MKIFADALRILSADMVEKANSGHPGMPLGMADLAAVLFAKHLKFNPKDPNWHNRDRFILSNGHGSALLYALLYLMGYPQMDVAQLQNFRQLGSITPGHPEYGLTPGVETTTGPLGQGIANAVGMAISEKALSARFGQELINHKIWVFCGDGCLQEGVSHEALSLAGHLGLNNLVIIYDDNQITIDGPTSLSFSENVSMRMQSYGFKVLEVDGHNHDAIDQAFATSQATDRPIFIKARTTIGFGAPTLAGTAKSHGSPLGAAELQGLRQALNWPYEAFVIPEDLLAELRQIWQRNASSYKNWQQLPKDELLSHYSGLKDDFWHQWPNLYSQGPNQTEATRASSGRVLEFITKAASIFIGGSADLTPSNNTKAKDLQAISRENFGGSYIHYGVREHAMAGIMNGIAIHGGFIPFGGTFLSFSDYMRPAIRLSALMKLQVVYVMTHDSIGLGEDGPTHQPVEHLSSLRLIPNLRVLRPADFIETAECWQIALMRHDGPTLLALSRQNLPQINSPRKQNMCSRGGYIIEDDPNFTVTIFASGSELHIAQEVAAILRNHKHSCRLVSVPSLELLLSQEGQYITALTCNSSLKVAIEAGVEGSWPSLIGPHGKYFGVNCFGESAPMGDLFAHFGLEAKQIASKLMAILEQS